MKTIQLNQTLIAKNFLTEANLKNLGSALEKTLLVEMGKSKYFTEKAVKIENHPCYREGKSSEILFNFYSENNLIITQMSYHISFNNCLHHGFVELNPQHNLKAFLNDLLTAVSFYWFNLTSTDDVF